jgi:hypothetical protein
MWGILRGMTGSPDTVCSAKTRCVGAVILAALACAGALGPAAARAQGLDPQLQEIRTLIREKRIVEYAK